MLKYPRQAWYSVGWIWEKNWDEKVVLPSDRKPINVEADMYAALMAKIEEVSNEDRSAKQSRTDPSN